MLLVRLFFRHGDLVFDLHGRAFSLGCACPNSGLCKQATVQGTAESAAAPRTIHVFTAVRVSNRNNDVFSACCA